MQVILRNTWNRKGNTAYTRAISRAVEIAGGTDELAAFLGSSTREINTWTSGETSPPLPIFLAIVDIVSANELTPVALENLPMARVRRSSANSPTP